MKIQAGQSVPSGAICCIRWELLFSVEGSFLLCSYMISLIAKSILWFGDSLILQSFSLSQAIAWLNPILFFRKKTTTTPSKFLTAPSVTLSERHKDYLIFIDKNNIQYILGDQLYIASCYLCRCWFCSLNNFCEFYDLFTLSIEKTPKVKMIILPVPVYFTS